MRKFVLCTSLIFASSSIFADNKATDENLNHYSESDAALLSDDEFLTKIEQQSLLDQLYEANKECPVRPTFNFIKGRSLVALIDLSDIDLESLSITHVAGRLTVRMSDNTDTEAFDAIEEHIVLIPTFGAHRSEISTEISKKYNALVITIPVVHKIEIHEKADLEDLSAFKDEFWD